MNRFPKRANGPILCDLIGDLEIKGESGTSMKIRVFYFLGGGNRISNKMIRCRYKKYISKTKLESFLSEMFLSELKDKIVFPPEKEEPKRVLNLIKSPVIKKVKETTAIKKKPLKRKEKK